MVEYTVVSNDSLAVQEVHYWTADTLYNQVKLFSLLLPCDSRHILVQ